MKWPGKPVKAPGLFGGYPKIQAARLFIDLPPMPNLQDQNNQFLVPNLVEDAVIPGPYAVYLFSTGKLCDAGRTGIGFKGSQSADDLSLNFEFQFL